MRITVSLSAVALLWVGLNAVAQASKIQSSPTNELASAVRGSLGVPLEDLDFKADSGRLLSWLNGGALLIVGAFAVLAGRRQDAGSRQAASRLQISVR